MRILPITQNTYYTGTNKTPTFTSDPYLVSQVLKFVEGNVQFNRQNVKQFKNIMQDRYFTPASDINRGDYRIFDAVLGNISNPYSGLFILNHYKGINPDYLKQYLFQCDRFYRGISRLDYSDRDLQLQLRGLYKYLFNDLKMKDSEANPAQAIHWGIKNNNVGFLKVLMDDRELVPVMKNGEVDVDVILEGSEHESPEIRRFFTDQYLMSKSYRRDNLRYEDEGPAYETYTMSDFYPSNCCGCGGYYRPKTDNIVDMMNAEKLHSPKSLVEKDEEQYGSVQLNTILDISRRYDFQHEMNTKYGASENSLLHLLAEVNINPNDKDQMKLIDRILDNCCESGYDFNMCDINGETALTKAIEAENVGVVYKLLEKANHFDLDINKQKDDGISAFDAGINSANSAIRSLMINITNYR